jgi:O-acetyl-ADP-ribose deacetylase (regulator of RNase III)
MKIVLAAIAEPLVDAWAERCGHLDGVRIHAGSILDVECDAVVSPANSFGFMDGGIDRAYRERFGPQVEERLQAAIRDHHHGELLVGTAEIVETRDPAVPYLLAAPTMRVPMILRDSVNAYLAARAALLLVRHGRFRRGERAGRPVADSVETVAFPGLGTGVGGIDPGTCATQMAAALVECLGSGSPFPGSWLEAQIEHQRLYSDTARDLQLE